MSEISHCYFCLFNALSHSSDLSLKSCSLYGMLGALLLYYVTVFSVHLQKTEAKNLNTCTKISGSDILDHTYQNLKPHLADTSSVYSALITGIGHFLQGFFCNPPICCRIQKPKKLVCMFHFCIKVHRISNDLQKLHIPSWVQRHHMFI